MAGKNRKSFRTSLGWAGVVASPKGVVRVVLPKASRIAVERELSRSERLGRQRSRAGGMRSAEQAQAVDAGLLHRTVKLLKRGLAGKAVSFDLPLDLDGYTSFQRAVWRAAAVIPFGETRSYAWIAGRIKRPKAARAVGQAMGANPVPLLIP